MSCKITIQFSMLDEGKLTRQARRTQGYLDKKSTTLFSFWQRRYFTIIDGTLRYFDDQTMQNPHKSIPLTAIRDVKKVEDLELQLLTPERVYELRAVDESTRDLWAGSLEILTRPEETTPESSEYGVKQKAPRRESPTRQTRSKKMTNQFRSSVSERVGPRFSRWKMDFSGRGFLETVCLGRLAEQYKEERVQSKVLLMKEAAGCYFVVSCKTLLHPWEDDDLMSEQLVQPYDFNCLYYYQYDQEDSPQVVEICKCRDITDIRTNSDLIVVQAGERELEIAIEKKRMEVIDMFGIINKLKSAAAISQEYHNTQGVKLTVNVDRIVRAFKEGDMAMGKITEGELHKVISKVKSSKEVYGGSEVRRVACQVQKLLNAVRDCCQVKQPAQTEFKTEFTSKMTAAFMDYFTEQWQGCKHCLSMSDVKMIALHINSIHNISEETSLLNTTINLQNHLIALYQDQIQAKLQICFTLPPKDIFHSIDTELPNNPTTSDIRSSFLPPTSAPLLSNTIYRQLHLDLHFTLDQLSQLPLPAPALPHYHSLLTHSLNSLQQMTLHAITTHWSSPQLLLASLNQTQHLTQQLLPELESNLPPHPQQHSIISQLSQTVQNINAILMKKLFVVAFKDLNKTLLKQTLHKLQIKNICSDILAIVSNFKQVTLQTLRTIHEAAFEETCFFYFTIVTGTTNTHLTHIKTVKKVTDDVKMLGSMFEPHLEAEKLNTHLGQLGLLSKFIDCEAKHVPSLGQRIKSVYGNAFNTDGLRNLISMKELEFDQRADLLRDCQELIKNAPEDLSLETSVMSGVGQSLRDSMHNRSRTSTIIHALNDLSESQDMIIGKLEESITVPVIIEQVKGGYLIKRGGGQGKSVKTYFKLIDGQLVELTEQDSSEILYVYDLLNMKKCHCHPEKPSRIILDLTHIVLTLKAASHDEAQKWVNDIIAEFQLATEKGPSSKKTESKKSTRYSPRESKEESIRDASPQASRLHSKSMKQQGPMSPLERKNSLRDNPIRSKSPKKVKTKPSKQMGEHSKK